MAGEFSFSCIHKKKKTFSLFFIQFCKEKYYHTTHFHSIIYRSKCRKNEISNVLFFFLFSELFAKYSCTYCQEDIIGVRVHCADCVDFELCPQVCVDVCVISVFTTVYVFVFDFFFFHCSALRVVQKLEHIKMITNINSWQA